LCSFLSELWRSLLSMLYYFISSSAVIVSFLCLLLMKYLLVALSDDELLSAGVGYGWDENLNQHMLMILPRWRNQDVSVTANDSTSAMTLSQRHGGVIGLSDLKEYSPVESEAD